MLRPRITPCLLIHDSGLVKTVRFKDAKYVGDPINAVRIFNEKEADELIVLDIDATVQAQEPNYQVISSLASECRMPLCYGGGIRNVEQAKKIISLGVEKVAISAMALENPSLITEISEEVGRQSVVVILDIKKKLFSRTYEVWTHNGKSNSKRDILDVIKSVQDLGAGEVVVNFIDHDGCMNGYDLDMILKLKKMIKVPFTVLGGAGSLKDMAEVVSKCGLVGLAAGSLFVFKGVYKAVLINYPNHAVKDECVYGKCNV